MDVVDTLSQKLMSGFCQGHFHVSPNTGVNNKTYMLFKAVDSLRHFSKDLHSICRLFKFSQQVETVLLIAVNQANYWLLVAN